MLLLANGRHVMVPVRGNPLDRGRGQSGVDRIPIHAGIRKVIVKHQGVARLWNNVGRRYPESCSTVMVPIVGLWQPSGHVQGFLASAHPPGMIRQGKPGIADAI